MKSEYLFYLFCFYLFFQVLLLGPVIVFATNLFFKKYLVLKMHSTGFLLPFFFFYAKGLEFKTSGHNKTDIVKFKAEKIYFWINPLFLFIGKIRIYNFQLLESEMKYINRIPSIQKTKYMPSIGRVKIQSANIKNASIDIEDRTVFPLYKSMIKNIELVNSQIDLGIPLRLIFDSEYGYCSIDEGDVLTSCESGKGSLQVRGVTWGKLINLELLPIAFLKNKIDLDVSFSHDTNKTELIGSLGQIDRDPIKQEEALEKKRINYKFKIDWHDYQLPFDLGLKKIIYQLFSGVNYGGVFSITVDIIAEGVGKLLNKLNSKPKENTMEVETESKVSEE